MDPRYPIGKFEPKESYAPEEVDLNIARIAALPQKLEKAVAGLSPSQLDTPYRDGGWTVRQVVHHVPDSHMNAYIRLKWTLTEERPLIKAYNEKEWAQTGETKADPGMSIELLKALHTKWVAALRSLGPSDLKKEFVHPDTGKATPLERQIAMYAWHGEHHVAHITTLRSRMGW